MKRSIKKRKKIVNDVKYKSKLSKPRAYIRKKENRKALENFSSVNEKRTKLDTRFYDVVPCMAGDSNEDYENL